MTAMGVKEEAAVKQVQIIKRSPRRPLPTVDTRTPSGRRLPF
jgi:hypothetical protein